MASESNVQVAKYWAGQLAQSEPFRKMLGATDLEWIDRSLHGDPPVALFEVTCSNGASKKLWCEISGAWRSKAGKQETCEASEEKRIPPGETHKVVVGPADRIADSVVQAILEERGEDSYCELKRKYGPGHLHLFPSCDLHPLFNELALSRISARLREEDLQDQDMFQSISFGHDKQVYCLWPDSDSPDPVP